MTREDIIRMAGEAGWSQKDIDSLLYIVETVAAAEREACARICEDRSQNADLSNHRRVDADRLARAIRARGQA